MKLPPWVVLHVPHDSTAVPSSLRGQFLLDDAELDAELDRLTDHHTLALFSEPGSGASVVWAPVSRLVVDVERFVGDEDEPMAGRGMGAVYTVASDLKPLRRPLTAEQRGILLREHYFPHHARLEAAVGSAIDRFGRCLILDCHSFPSRPLPYEFAAPGAARPDVCIGTDPFHTSEELLDAFVASFGGAWASVSVNAPFAGALVPKSRYRRDRRVQAIMVEVNRRLYTREPGAERLPDFDQVVREVRRCCATATTTCRPWGGPA